MLSLAEENYLKSIYHLSESGTHSVSTNAIAEMQNTKPASVSDMIKKLSIKGLVSYQRYRGVNVSDKGLKIALQIIRKHRLWEVFLVDKLKFNWNEVHDVAEQLEHIQSSLLTQRLDEFLGFPRVDPHGDPIPDEHGQIVEANKIPLSQVALNRETMIVGVENSESDFLAHLDKISISIGCQITVLDKNKFDGSLQLKLRNKAELFISKQVADNLLVNE